MGVYRPLQDAEVTPQKLSGGQSGAAPAYACRAWVNFNGTGVVAIRASGNVSSITDNGLGDYTVNFTVQMQDANYCVQIASGDYLMGQLLRSATVSASAAPSVSGVRVIHSYEGGYGEDANRLMVAVFR